MPTSRAQSIADQHPAQQQGSNHDEGFLLVAGEAEKVTPVMHELVHILALDQWGCALFDTDEIDRQHEKQAAKDSPDADRSEFLIYGNAPESTELELLNSLPWRCMLMAAAIDQNKVCAEKGWKAFGAMARDGKAAALFGAVGCDPNAGAQVASVSLRSFKLIWEQLWSPSLRTCLRRGGAKIPEIGKGPPETGPQKRA
jgi:hypothetical protein